MSALRDLAHELRELCVELSLRHTTCHLASALSLAEIMVALRFRVLRDDDALLLSKGHAASALYGVQALAGEVDRERLLEEYCADGGAFGGHPERGQPGVVMSGGSLGHGPSLALGLALGRPASRVYCVCGDGELNEGSVWEAIQLAGRLGLANLVLVVDANGYQGLGAIDEVIRLDPLVPKLEAWGWEGREVDGHDVDALVETLAAPAGRPLCVVARTAKGKGLDFLERAGFRMHYRSLKPHERELAYAALERGRG